MDESSGEYVAEMDGIKKNDAGTYTVTAVNKFGTESAPATLMVTDKEEEAQDWKSQLKKTSVLVHLFWLLTFYSTYGVLHRTIIYRMLIPL